MSEAKNLAAWILREYPYSDRVTHLKLQKLAFYCFGAALALGFDEELGLVTFESWQHGPVCREIWEQYRDCGAHPLPAPGEVRDYSATASQHLRDVLTVYGRLSAWSLRQETHLEAPWVDGRNQPEINRQSLLSHFAKKFAAGQVRYPEHFFGSSSFALDRIPVPVFGSLREMARTLHNPT